MTHYRTYWRELAGWQLHYSPGDNFPEGKIADFTIWSKPLTNDEIIALDKGLRPHQVAPQKLVKWLPLDAMDGTMEKRR